MATLVEKERSKAKQISRMEEKLNRIEESLEKLSVLIQDLSKLEVPKIEELKPVKGKK